MLRQYRFAAGCALLVLGTMTCRLAVADAVTRGLEAEDFQFQGDWRAERGGKDESGAGFLFAGPHGADLPAVTAIDLSRAGRYTLWVRARDFADYMPGARKLTVSIQGQRSQQMFGDSGCEGWSWEHGGVFELPAGRVLIGIHDVDQHYARIDALLLTTDDELQPEGPLGTKRLPRVRPVQLEMPEATVPDSGEPSRREPLAPRPAKVAAGEPVAALENEHVRVEFLPAVWNDQPTVQPKVSVRRGDGWQQVAADSAAEMYVVTAAQDVGLAVSAGLPSWVRDKQTPIMIRLGDVSIETGKGRRVPEIWRAGEPYRFQPRVARRVDERVQLEFAPSPVGTLVAEWSLQPGERAARVKLSFLPAADGIYGLGYHLFFRRPVDEVEELQLPMMWQRKRLPKQAHALLDPRTPTPLALAQTGRGEDSLVWAVVGEPAEIPFAWPDDRKPHMGLVIRDEAGLVQPAIYGPVPGTDRAVGKAGQAMDFGFRVLVQPGDWYAGYRTAADEVFGFRDYRRNRRVSLTEAALNMVDLMMDDEYGGWWRKAKGWYQIESHNTVTHAAPATVLSLYRLTGDERLYRRRALPTMEYVLSRDSAHFSPNPEDPGRYSIGGMTGPVKLFGTSTFAALARLSNGYSPVFGSIALPDESNIRPTVGYSHAGSFNEWAARYRLTGDSQDLDEACRLADEYIAKTIDTAPNRPIRYTAFWLISFVPDWEGLLMMYELTGRQEYLDASAFGARQLMTGLWTQPNFPDGSTTLYAGGEYEGDPWSGHLLARGPLKSRLGFPLREDSLAERRTEAWVVSPVGLGFEQPSTLGIKYNRLIYQAVWAPEFLRLARYTGDTAFATHARNAVVGRFGNYPGYYVGGHFDLNLDPAYPLVGPDLSVLYYHHIMPHLSWTIDYLVADAELLSQGKIEFPAERENGYAYFDGKVYGHAPGTIFDQEGCWLWLKRGAAVVSNPQMNYLTAYNADRFFVVLMNQSTREESTSVYFSQQAIGFDPAAVTTVTRRDADGAGEAIEFEQGMVQVTLPGRGLAVLELDGCHIDIAAHQTPSPSRPGAHPSHLETAAGDIRVKAAAIQTRPGPWDAYIWCNAEPDEAAKVTLHYVVNKQQQTVSDSEYPFEFELPVADGKTPVAFHLEVVTGGPDPQTLKTPEQTLAAPQPAE